MRNINEELNENDGKTLKRKLSLHGDEKINYLNLGNMLPRIDEKSFDESINPRHEGHDSSSEGDRSSSAPFNHTMNFT